MRSQRHSPVSIVDDDDDDDGSMKCTLSMQECRN